MKIFRPFLETLMTSITSAHSGSRLCFSFLLSLLFCFPAFCKLSMSLYVNINQRNTCLYLAVAPSLSDGFGLRSQAHAFAFVILWLWWCVPLQSRPSTLTSEGIWWRESRAASKFHTIVQQIDWNRTWKLWKYFSIFPPQRLCGNIWLSVF